MGISRRDFIQSTAVAVGATTVTTIIPSLGQAATEHQHTTQVKGKTFDPSKEPKRVRKNFYDLTDSELVTFMSAIGYMRNNLKLNDPLQWDNYARIHALHCTEANEDHPQVHWSWNFLPWHRGYLYFLERILADCLTKQGLDGDNFALPYWDWTVHKEIPNTRERKAKGLASPFFGYDPTLEDMVNPDGLSFDNSALYEGNRGPSITKPEMDPKNELTQDSKDHVTETLGFMSPQYIGLMLTTPWEQFLGSPVTDRQTGQGLLEQGPHNDGHDWVGSRFGKNRTMGTLRTAAGDPMFYMHHGNIDRIWSLYKKEQPDPKGDWGKQQYNFLDIDGSTLTLSVQDIIEKLTNIEYAPAEIEIKTPLRAVPNKPTKTVKIGKEINDKPITVSVPKEMLEYGSIILSVDTGTIDYTGRYTVKIKVGNKVIGKINFLDGEHRETNAGKDLTHTFNLLLTDLPKGNSITFVPPIRGTFTFTIKSLSYKPI